jgi:hypothetical protein
MTESPDSKPSGFVSGLDRLLLDFSSRAITSARNSRVPWDHGGHSLSAIILAAAAVEAHIGEWLARPDNRNTFDAGAQAWKGERKKSTAEIAKCIVKIVSGKSVGSEKAGAGRRAEVDLLGTYADGRWPSLARGLRNE